MTTMMQPQFPTGLGIALDTSPTPRRPGLRESTFQSLHASATSAQPQSNRPTGSGHTVPVPAIVPATCSADGTQRSTAATVGDGDLGERFAELSSASSYDLVGSQIPPPPTEDAAHGSGAYVRSDTLLSFGVSQTRNTAELRALMGNANARLKPGATVVPRNRRALRQEAKDGAQGPVSLEQAKPRARVEVDIVLENNACVQGGYLRGHVKIRVRKRSKKEAPILLADGKIRVIGFECIPSEADRHTFYQCASPLSAIATGLDRLYELPSDTDGFAQAIEGVHILPFAMRLPADGKFGAAKGITSVHSGIAVQYIAMVSVKVKCSKTGRRSIAHFYRHCEVWPRINPSVVLVPAPRPLQAATSKGLSVLSSNSKVKLTALVHRLTWLAGQRCYVNVHVVNETKKTVKSLTLTLVRTTTLFRPKPFLDAGQARTADPDACQTNTMHKVVAESILEMAHRGTKRHASAKGWWTGVAPGQELSFSHYILIPPDALSVTRGRLLEVEHSLRVTLSAGSLSSDIHVTLPIRIINFMSIDPIPSDNSHPTMGAHVRPLQRRRSIDGELAAETYPPHTWSALAQGGYTGIPSFTSSLYDHVSSHEDQLTLLQRAKKTRRAVEASRPRPSGSILRVRNPDRDTHESSTSDAAPSSSGEDDDVSVYSSDTSGCLSNTDESMTSASEAESHTRGLDSLELDDPDSDEEVGMVIGAAAVDDDEPTLAGQEYGSCASRVSVPRPTGPREGHRFDRGRSRERRPIQRNTAGEDAAARGRAGLERMTSFAQRVDAKLAAAKSHSGMVSASGAAGASEDADATPRLAQGRPPASTQPLRPARHPGRSKSAHPPAHANTPKFPCPTHRTGRALPRPPATTAFQGADGAYVCGRAGTGPEDASAVRGTGAGGSVPARPGGAGDVQPPLASVSAGAPALDAPFGVDCCCDRDRAGTYQDPSGGAEVRGRSSAPTSAGDHPHQRERPPVGGVQAGVSAMIRELEERVQSAIDAGNAYV